MTSIQPNAPPATCDAPPGRSYSRLLLALVAAAAVGAYWIWSMQRQQAAESLAAQSLEKLGALVVMDGDRRHVATVNLSTVATPEALAQAIALLPALPHVTSLDASRTSIGDEHLVAVGQLTSLKTLTMNDTRLSDAAVAELRSLTGLESLFLSGVPLTDAGVEALGSLTALRLLDLSQTQVASNLKPLQSMMQLKWLLLRNLSLADDALPQLQPLTQLGRLSLGGSKYSAAALDALQKALPELEVDR